VAAAAFGEGVGLFAVEGGVEAFLLDVLGDAEAHHLVEDLEQDEADQHRVGGGDRDGDQLLDQE
jgi:hypothetical protein